MAKGNRFLKNYKLYSNYFAKSIGLIDMQSSVCCQCLLGTSAEAWCLHALDVYRHWSRMAQWGSWLSQARCGGMCQAPMFLTQLWGVHGNMQFRRSSYSQLTTCEHYLWSGSENGTLFDERNLWINRPRNSQLCSPAHFSPSPTHEGKCEGTLCTSHVGYRVLNPQRRSELSSVNLAMFPCWHGAAFPYFCCCHCLNKTRPIVYLVLQAGCGNVVTVALP